MKNVDKIRSIFVIPTTIFFILSSLYFIISVTDSKLVVAGIGLMLGSIASTCCFFWIGEDDKKDKNKIKSKGAKQ